MFVAKFVEQWTAEDLTNLSFILSYLEHLKLNFTFCPILSKNHLHAIPPNQVWLIFQRMELNSQPILKATHPSPLPRISETQIPHFRQCGTCLNFKPTTSPNPLLPSWPRGRSPTTPSSEDTVLYRTLPYPWSNHEYSLFFIYLSLTQSEHFARGDLIYRKVQRGGDGGA